MERIRRNPELWLALGLATLWWVPRPGPCQPLPPLLGLDAYLAVPAENPLTMRKSELGKRLFFDKRLSADGSVSCAVCHEPERAFTDSRRVAVGAFGRVGTRRVPKLVNRGFGASFFWDGSAPTLEEQVFKPILNPLEMALAEDEAVRRVRQEGTYLRAFEQAFGEPPSKRTVSYALASYVRTIRSGDSAYDRYQAGDTDALTAAQKRGLRLFRGKANCVVCHLGPNFTDEEFHNTGVGWNGATARDLGRWKITGRDEDAGKFKTPTLREASLTAPYMHDGSLASLRDVIDFYDDGGVGNPYLDPEVVPLGLTGVEKADLEAFLEALNGRVTDGI